MIRRSSSRSEPQTTVPSSGLITVSNCHNVEDNPLGLSVVWSPDESPSVDIVFIHGLGGKSMGTWAAGGKPSLFWPKEFLSLEPVIQTARVSTFGYYADFRTRAPKNFLDIEDFALRLLSDLKNGQDAGNNNLNIGQVPVIFIVHSMGGLVVKKAYVRGSDDNKFQKIIHSTGGIMFLSTPHQGSDLAKLLNHVLKMILPGRSSKKFISELEENSPALLEMNERFRDLSKDLSIFSFYETIAMTKYIFKKLILKKKSSILGHEMAIPLYADHRDTARFSSINDANYVSVRNVLKSLVITLGFQKPYKRVSERMSRIQTWLAIKESPEDDYLHFRQQRTPGSCDWILTNGMFLSWLQDVAPKPRVIWLYGDPGTGKSVLTSRIIEHIRDERHLNCQFVYFRYGVDSKRSPLYLLRSLAYQAAYQFPKFERQIATLDHLSYQTQLVIWHEVFRKLFFRLPFNRPLYWVIDAADECTEQSSIISFLNDLQEFSIPLRIVFISCWTGSLSDGFKELPSKIKFDSHEILASGMDIAKFVELEFRKKNWNGKAKTKQAVLEKVLELAEGNFLWASLMVTEILRCHTEAGVTMALESLSPDLAQRYNRIYTELRCSWKEGERELAKMFLTWAAFSRFPLTVKAISRAVESRFGKLLDPLSSLSQVCGNFIKIDSKSRVLLVHHHTTYKYLTRPGNHEPLITSTESHIIMLRRCLEVLSDSSLKLQEGLIAPDSLSFYAATSWSYHLAAAGSPPDKSLLHLLLRFLSSESVLTWICILARGAELTKIVHASNALRDYARMNENDPNMKQVLYETNSERTLELWAADFVKVHARFGECLLEHPTSIYKLITPFCPADSLISKLHARTNGEDQLSQIVVTGSTKGGWGDCLTTHVIEREYRSCMIVCTGLYFAVLTSSLDGRVHIFHSKGCGKAKRITHDEPVLAVQFSNSGDLLATYGLSTTKVWDVATRQELYTFDNPSGVSVLAIGFEVDDKSILICSSDRRVRRAFLHDKERNWHSVGSILQTTDQDIASRAPNCASFNQDCTLLAVAYRGCPTSIWNISTQQIAGTFEKTSRRESIDVVQMGWSAISGHVVGTYIDGSIFKTHPSDLNQVHIVEADATIVRCSPTGKFLVSNDDSGSLNIWSFEGLALLYHLPETSTIIDLAVSADGKRIYGLQGYYCTVWEPDTLIRLAESDESTLGSSTISVESSEAPENFENFTDVSDSIEAFAVGQTTSMYCVGRPNGAVNVFKRTGESLATIAATGIPIEHIALSGNEEIMVVVDVSTRLYVKSIDKASGVLGTVFEERIGDPVQQILFSKAGNLLLVVTRDSLRVWSLQKTPTMIDHMSLDKDYHWINDPVKDTFLLGFGPYDVRKVRWDNLRSGHVLGLNRTRSLSTSTHTTALSLTPLDPPAAQKVRKALVSRNGSLILLHMSANHGRQDFLILRTSDIKSVAGNESSAITVAPLAQSLQEKIDRPLDFFSADVSARHRNRRSRGMDSDDTRLAFINNRGWLCSVNFEVTGQTETLMKHVYFPQDWLNTDSLEMARVLGNGDVCWPKDGEIRIISNWITSSWAY
ncbi:hypothetical protein BP5796_11983 [Coleophoma crateriformis]|uniref:Uncharacterized protein n=1 Tax=Coleophoma crateriformis TaxID=565419 RepID=A0A3D8QBB6_9HELO|nr:hypothetical protein BP5796_11983 [Coleophoma crateriformis]